MNYSEERLEELRYKYDDRDDSEFIRFRETYLEDEDQIVTFDVEGYIYNDKVIVEDYNVFLFNGEDDYIELKGKEESKFWFELIGKKLLVVKLEKNGYYIEEVED